MRWTPVPVVGGAYSDDTRPWSVQDTVNYLPQMAERAGTRSPSILRGAPGMVEFADLGTNLPIRGTHDVEGLLLAVSDRSLFRVDPDGTPHEIGTIPGVSRVSMAHNQIEAGHEVLIANGLSGYVYNTRTGALTQITDPGFPGMRVVDFVDGYLAGVEPAGRYWFHSDLRRATEYNTLDRADAEASPDRIVGLIVSHREVMVMGRRSGQFFRNTGAATGTFQNSNGTEMEVGLASPYAIARLDNTVYWLGHDGVIYRLNGNQPERVSVGPVEQAISRCDISKAFAFTFEDRGHKVFYLTFPDGQTWGFDVWTGEFHRRESKGLNRWRINTLTRSRGQWIAGDYANGKLYRLDWNAQHEAGAEMVRRRVTGVLHDEQNPVTVNAVSLVFDTGGRGRTDSAPLTITGDLPGATVGVPVAPYTYTVSGGRQPYGPRTIVAGSLPPGLAMSAAGTVTGTPTQPGLFTWTVRVSDEAGAAATLRDSALVIEVLEDPAWFAAGASLANQPAGQGSPDGLDWTTPLTVDLNGTGLFSGNGRLVVVTNTGGRTSVDLGETWIPHTGPATEVLVRGDYAGGVYFISTNGGAGPPDFDGQDSRRSTDGINFTKLTLPSNFRRINKFIEFAGLVYGFGEVSVDGNYVTTANGGVSWAGPFVAHANEFVNDAATDGEVLVAATATGRLVVTTDGASWSQASSPFGGASVDCLRYGNGVWVAVSEAGQIATGATPDALVIGSYALATAPGGLDFGHGRFIVVGISGDMATSLDGTDWTGVPNLLDPDHSVTGIAAYRSAE